MYIYASICMYTCSRRSRSTYAALPDGSGRTNLRVEAYRFNIVYRQSPEDPSFRALSGRLKVTVRRHRFNRRSRSTYAALPDGSGLTNLSVGGSRLMVEGFIRKQIFSFKIAF